MIAGVFLTIVLAITYGLFILTVYVLVIRNNKVNAYRKRLARRIYEQSIAELNEAREDVRSGKRSLESYTPTIIKHMGAWRWKEYEAVEYNNMVFKFWKSLPSFYVDSELEQDLYDPNHILKEPLERQHRLMTTLKNKRQKTETKHDK